MNRVTDPRGESLKLIVPSQTAIGQPFTVTLVAFLPNGRTNWHYDGTLHFEVLSDPKVQGAGQVHAIPVAGGAFKHTMRLLTAGLHRISVRDEEREMIALSNAIVAYEDAPELNLYWGDIHIHAGERNRHQEISDAYASIDYNYHFGRHVAGLDFMALSDHDHLGSWRRGIIPIWNRFKKAAEYFYRPGEFVTLLGWEWTNGIHLCPGRPQYGQKCVYFRDGDGPIFSASDPGSDTPEKLYDHLRAHRCFVIPHHVSAPINFYNDWDHHDPGIERLVEIYSGWGCGERSAGVVMVPIIVGRPQYGQKCVYFRDGDGPIFSASDPGSDTPEKLYDHLRAHRCFVIPHHVSAPINFYNDWDHHDPGIERLVEIYSGWGCGERSADDGNAYPIRPDREGDMKGHHVIDALARGHTLGFTAGGDTHDAAPGIGHTFNGLTGRFENQRWGGFKKRYRPGLQGVWAEDLTRESIFESIYSRRSYGTTGARIIVNTELNGAPMGTVFALQPAHPFTYRAHVVGTNRLKQLEIVRNGETVYVKQPDSETCDIEFTDPFPIDDRAYYYLRVTQEDSHMAWASPHFLPGKAG